MFGVMVVAMVLFVVGILIDKPVVTLAGIVGYALVVAALMRCAEAEELCCSIAVMIRTVGGVL